MTTALSSLREAAAAFFAWWLGELAGLAPAGLRRRLVPAARTVEVEVGAESIELREVRGERSRELGRVRRRGEHAIERAEIERALRSAGGQRTRSGLHLADDRLLRDQIQLPAAAEENLREVVTFQLDRLTPFTPDEVFFDCRVAARRPERGTIAVDLVLVPRAVVREALALAAAWGLRPRYLTYAGDTAAEPGRMNLLPPDARPATPRGLAMLNAGLAAVAVGLAAMLVVAPMERDRRHAAALEAALVRERAAVDAVEKRVTERDLALRGAALVLARKREAPPVTISLDRLTRLLPDDTWLSSFRLRSGKIDIVGNTPSSSRIIGLVEKSSSFKDARAVAPVRRDPRTGLETFRLEFTPVNAKEP